MNDAPSLDQLMNSVDKGGVAPAASGVTGTAGASVVSPEQSPTATKDSGDSIDAGKDNGTPPEAQAQTFDTSKKWQLPNGEVVDGDNLYRSMQQGQGYRTIQGERDRLTVTVSQLQEQNKALLAKASGIEAEHFKQSLFNQARQSPATDNGDVATETPADASWGAVDGATPNREVNPAALEELAERVVSGGLSEDAVRQMVFSAYNEAQQQEQKHKQLQDDMENGLSTIRSNVKEKYRLTDEQADEFVNGIQASLYDIDIGRNGVDTAANFGVAVSGMIDAIDKAAGYKASAEVQRRKEEAEASIINSQGSFDTYDYGEESAPKTYAEAQKFANKRAKQAIKHLNELP